TDSQERPPDPLPLAASGLRSLVRHGPVRGALGCRGSNFLRDLRSRGQESNVLPRKAAAGAARGSLEPGHASLPGLAGTQLAAGIRRPAPAHRITAFVRWVTRSSSRAVPD